MKALTLLYHDVVPPGDYRSSGFQSPDANIYKLDRADFDSHLTAIAAITGRHVGLAVEALDPPDTQLRLTFDDGGASAYTCIADMLEERGWRGHFLVTTDYISQPGFLSPAEIRALQKRGHIIGSHSCSHPARMARCSAAELDREWRESVATLTAILGEAVQVASVPGGYFSHEVACAAAQAGIHVLFNSEPMTGSRTVDGCMILGRFSVQRGVPAEWVAAVAAGAAWPRFEAYLFWNLKKALKNRGGTHWLEFRKRVLAKRTDAQ